MPDAVAPAAPAPAAGTGQPAQPQQGSFLATILRMAFMWWLMSWFKGGQNNTAKQAAKDPLKFTSPLFTKGEPVDFYLFLAEQPFVSGGYNMQDLIWSETGVSLALKEPRNISYVYEPSKAVHNNGSLYLHALFARAGYPIQPTDPDYNENAVFGGVYNLITYLQKPKNSTGVNLLAGEKPKEPVKDEGPPEFISFLRPNLSIQVVDHFQTYNKAQIPPQVAPFLTYNEEANHFPIVWFNDFWLLRDYLVPMNDTLTNVTLHFDLGYASLTWWTLLNQMEKTFETQRGMGLQQEGESDELKRVFLEGNPVLLAITMVVSLLHTVFDMLAFKNDIGFWKNNKSMEGLSARSILINAFCQLVILLYLLDNETSYVVLFSSFVGTAIEFWKVTKAMKVTVDWTRFPYVKVEDRASYSKSQTKEHDEVAMRYLSYVLYPLVIGYAVYALMYKTHKSWYSWILSSLVGAVYMFGFILMCPQLYLNYKLKSVAHLPWRQMTYKFLNTIIDDLFAFVIKMPLLHRLSVFRDDVIFLIYLYQRWIYRVDMKRVNEFGWTGEADPAEDEAAAQAQITANGTTEADSDSAQPAGTSAGEADAQRSKRKDAQAAASAPKTDAAEQPEPAAGTASKPEQKKDK